MKRLLLTAALVAIGITGANAAVLISYDFAGSTATATYNTQASTFTATNISSSNMTRGAGISANNATNSFRGTGFSNNGISTSNTDYFQFTVAATAGNELTINSIYGNFNGTSSFSVSPGVTMAYAYSLDGGTTFTLMSSFVQIGTGNQTYTVTGADLTALTDVTSVVFRLYASGQTTTGGWGLQSAATAGTIGLSVDGSVYSAVPEPSTYVLIGMGLGSLLVLRRMKKSIKA